MINPQEVSRPWWRFDLRIWFILVVLLAVNIAFLSGLFKPEPRYLAWLVNSLDPRVWPAWVAGLLWGIGLWFAVDLPRWPESAIGLKQIAKPLLILFLLGLICYLNGWHAPNMRRTLYMQYYMPIIIAPWSNFITDGSLNWKMLIVPTSALIALIYLVRLFIQLRKNKKHENDSDRT